MPSTKCPTVRSGGTTRVRSALMPILMTSRASMGCQPVIPGRERSERARNLEIPRCAIAHLRSGPSDHPGMTEAWIASSLALLAMTMEGKGEGHKQLRRVGKGALAPCPPFLLKDAGGHAALCPPCVSAMRMERTRGKSNDGSGRRVRSMPVRESLHRDRYAGALGLARSLSGEPARARCGVRDLCRK